MVMWVIVDAAATFINYHFLSKESWDLTCFCVLWYHIKNSWKCIKHSANAYINILNFILWGPWCDLDANVRILSES